MGDGAHFTSLTNRVHSYIKTIAGKIAHIPLFIVSDINGNPVGVTRNSLDVHVADVHRKLISKYFVQTTATTDTLDGGVSSGDRQIIVNGTAFANNDWLSLVDGSISEPNYAQVLSGGGTSTLILDRELDNDYSNGAAVTKVNPNLSAVDGSVTPVSFRIAPPANEVWHILRILMSQIDATDFNTGGWWGVDPLTRGLHIRYVSNGVPRTITLWKKNADIVEDCYDWDPIAKPPAGQYGARTRYTLERAGAYIHLDGSMGDYIEVLVQDAMGEGLDLQIKGQGHVEE